MKNYTEYRIIEQYANAIAREAGYGKATSIIIGERATVTSHTDFGYRKNTTGEYVPNAYSANFGWKNTYYQAAGTVVSIHEEEYKYFYNK